MTIKRTIKLKKNGVKLLEDIVAEIKSCHTPVLCPNWRMYQLPTMKYEKRSCDTCKELFPKIDEWLCPCHVYTKDYLLTRLDEIIFYNRPHARKKRYEKKRG